MGRRSSEAVDRDDAAFPVRYDNALDAAGWTIVYHRITRDTRISDGAYRLYLLLHQYAQQSGSAWPSRETLARDLGVSVATIERRLQELVRIGLIERRKEIFVGTTTTYLLNPRGKYLQGLQADFGDGAERLIFEPFGRAERLKNEPPNGSNLSRHEEIIMKKKEEEEEEGKKEENEEAEAEIARALQENGVFPENAARIARRMASAGLTAEQALEIYLVTLREVAQPSVSDEQAIGRAVARLERGVWDTERARQALRRARYAASSPDTIQVGDDQGDGSIWQAVLGELQLELTRATFETLLRNSRLVACEEDRLVIGVSDYARGWLETRLRERIETVVSRVAGRPMRVQFKSEDQ